MSNLYLLQKAENTLKRADDLIEGGQSKIAFQELQTILSNVRLNKSRQWSEILEEVTLKCVTLAVELRSSSEAKQVLLYYKSICGLDHPQSIDKVLKHYVEMAEKSAKSAQAQSNTESLSLQKDLEDEVPENILMSEVSGEDLKDRKDREIVTPWLKFLWETYRTVLDLLKISPSKELQTRYHDTAHRAFKFCRDYKRILEFKRLSEMLRTHLTQIKLTYTKDSPYAKINVSNAETLQQFLDTRFKQLDVASELELYNEAYKSIEDIYSLMKLSKKAIDPNLMAKYCEHLSKIFWVSENYVLHSFAHYKLFNLKNASKQKEEKDLQLLASTLLLSALSIPSKHQSDDIVDVNFNEREKLQRMSLLLGLSVAPSKQMLLSEIVKKQVMSFVYPELKNIYTILEVDFHPLQLCAKITPALNYLKEHSQLKQYVKPLQQIVLSKLLLQLSKVYEVVKLSELAKLAPFVSLPQIERAIVSAVQQRTLQITIDHQNSALIFGKSVEPFDSEQIRNELTKLAQKLSHATYTMINPSLKQTETATYEKSVVSSLSKAEQEHLALLERKQLIEKKKIYIDNMKREQEELKEQRQREMAKQKEIAEKLQQEKQQQKREEEMRRRREEEEKREQQVKLIKELEQAGVVTEQTISAIAAKTGKKKSKLDIERDVDVETIMEVKREEIVKEQREKERKLLEEAKNLDYLERARRMEEIPMLKKRFEQQRHEDRESHEKSVKEAEQKFTKHIEEMKSQRALLEKMFSDKNVFATNFVMKKREEVYEQKISVYNQEVEKARQVWLKKREAIKAVVDKLEEEKREKQRQREEEDRRRQEEQDKIRRERDAERERLQRQSDIQAQKEREMEEAARLKREQLIGASRQQQQQQQPSRSTRWGTLEQESTSFGGRRRFDDDQPPRRRFDDEQPPRRRFDDEQPPRRRFDDNQGPPRRFDDNQGPPRRFDDEQPPRRRFDDNQAPPRKRFDDEPKRNDSTGGSGRWR